MKVPSGLEENLRFTSYRYDPVIGKYFAQARFYDGANGRMLGKDPVKRGLNPYRYCDDDPVDYVDPTGEILNIIGGAVLGGVFGGAGGLISSAISQKISGGKVDWKEAWGAAANGAITGAAQGGLLASGAGIPVALATNFLAGTAGSAAEQYISTGRVDTRKSITNGLNNAVSNLIYGTNPLGSVKEAFGRGFGAGAATSAINYISDLIGQKPVGSGVKAELLSGITGAAVSPFAAMRDPRRGCGSTSPFTFSLGYSTAKGYRYDTPQTTNQPQSQRRGFSLKAFLGETLLGGLTGGFTSAAFYGAGKGIERIKESVQSVRSIGGHRTNRSRQLTDAEIAQLLEDIDALGADPSVFRFNEGSQTGFSDRTGNINVRGDVLPDLSSNHPRDLMSTRAVLAHEYYGHKHFDDVFGTRNPAIGAWNDEFRASYNAALNAPNLSDMDRMLLMQDALERAREANVSIHMTDTIRRILYGE